MSAPASAEAGPLGPPPNPANPANPAAPACHVVVVSYNSARYLPELVRGVRRAADQAGRPVRIHVVDNDSADDSVTVARDLGAEVVATGSNLGYAAAINVVQRTAPAGDHVLVLNPDLEVDAGAIAELLRAAAENPGAGVLVPSLRGLDGGFYPSLRNEPTALRTLLDALLGGRMRHLPRRFSEMVWSPAHYERLAPTDWATGAAMLVTPEARRRVGDWDERFFLYSEETDYCRRVRAAGLAVLHVPAAVVRHDGAGSGTSAELVALNAVNRVRYVTKHRGALAGNVFRAIAILHSALRVRQPVHRVTLRYLLSPSQWRRLPGLSSVKDL